MDDSITIYYPNFSDWIVGISKGKSENGKCFVSVVADTTKTYIRGRAFPNETTMFGIVDEKEWDDLENGTFSHIYSKANSTGATFYHKWLTNEINFYKGFDEKEKAIAEGTALETDENIDGGTLTKIIEAKKLEQEGQGKMATKIFQDIVDEGKYNAKVVESWREKARDVEGLYNHTLALSQALSEGQLANKSVVAKLLHEVEGTFGISISKKIGYKLINSISYGAISPATIVAWRYKIKNVYDAIDKGGIKGAEKIGRRFIQAHNPLIQNRSMYRLSKVKNAIEQQHKKHMNVLKKGSKEYEKAILTYHRQILKEEASGIVKKNSLKLVRTKEGNLMWRGSQKAMQIEKLGVETAEKLEVFEDILDLASFIPEVRPVALIFKFVINVFLFKGMISKKKKDEK